MSAVDEDSLIKSRPLTVEERPFKRISKRCAQLTINPNGTPPQIDFEKFREEAELDFELFEITIARIQLLQHTNRREIERYEAEKVNILRLSEQARHDMALLRDLLAAAQQEKANRLEYDTIANDILSTKVMRLGREEQRVNMQRLEAEIVELEEERRQYGEVWQTRREQFGEIVGRLEKMQEQIQEDKEEHDRREGMDEEEGEEGEEIENPTPVGGIGGSGKSGGSTGDRSGAATPLAMSTVPSAGQTPLRQARDVNMVDPPSGKVDEADKMDTS
ncbi:tho complex subunit 7 [Tirmania nivea]|nr:tho complex subunit 7 [Tirmania nivea]